MKHLLLALAITLTSLSLLSACGLARTKLGGECEVDDDCVSRFCFHKVCQGSCKSDEDCVAGTSCKTLVSGGSPACFRPCSGDDACVGEHTCVGDYCG